MDIRCITLLTCCVCVTWKITESQLAGNSGRNDVCHNGGICRTNDSSPCPGCICPVGFTGLFCENVLTRLVGDASFTKSVGASNQPNNATAMQQLIFNVVARTTTNTSVKVTISGTINVVAKLTICFDRPASWLSYTDALPLQQRIETTLREPTSLQAIFGAPGVASFKSLTLDVQECLSNWDNCSQNAQCINLPNAYRCVCDRGYSGDGVTCTEILCQLGNVPELPTFATRKVISPNGTELTDPPQIARFGTLVEYICAKHYTLADAVTSSTNPDVIECGGSPKYSTTNWSGSKVTCNIDTSLKIAIIMSVVSSLIIIAVLGGFMVDFCVKREKKAKDQRRLKEEDIGVDNDVFNHP